ncbi:MAG: trypsin-like peptidase domain-containing protein [Microthrixaceae bacterium]
MALARATLLGVVLGTGAHVAVGAGASSPLPTAPAAQVAGVAIERGARLDAVVEVAASGCGVTRQASATIVRGTRDAVVLTNAHVVAGAGTVELRTAAGTVTASVAGAVRGRDVAVLRVDPATWPAGEGQALPTGTRPVRTGDRLSVVGFPGGLAERRVGDVVSIEARTGYGGTTPVLVIGAPADPGLSGGAVVDDSGAVVGLVAARDPSTGATVAYPVAELLSGRLGPPPGC